MARCSVTRMRHSLKMVLIEPSFQRGSRALSLASNLYLGTVVVGNSAQYQHKAQMARTWHGQNARREQARNIELGFSPTAYDHSYSMTTRTVQFWNYFSLASWLRQLCHYTVDVTEILSKPAFKLDHRAGKQETEASCNEKYPQKCIKGSPSCSPLPHVFVRSTYQ